MTEKPFMPKATAVWLVENTALTFDQIAEFCSLHPLEVKGIADGDVAQGIRGMDPIMSGELTRVELEAAEQNSEHTLKLNQTIVELPETTTKKQKKYTPLSRRQDRPAAIAWLVRNHSELKDSEVIRLVGTTKSTIESIRNRTHWNIGNIQPQDPVVLGLCSQIELDKLVLRASKRVEREAQKENKTLQSTADTPD